jgi:hypothetical protein
MATKRRTDVLFVADFHDEVVGLVKQQIDNEELESKGGKDRSVGGIEDELDCMAYLSRRRNILSAEPEDEHGAVSDDNQGHKEKAREVPRSRMISINRQTFPSEPCGGREEAQRYTSESSILAKACGGQSSTFRNSSTGRPGTRLQHRRRCS